MRVYNKFFFEGKIPSLNELVDFKASVSPMKRTWLVHSGKKPGTYRFNKYNQVKQDWSKKVETVVAQEGFETVEACYFTYIVVEKTRKRDPSNICSSSAKLIEDGLIKAGVIPNDGWNNVLGICNYWVHEPKGTAGVLVLMTDVVIMPCTAMELYGQSKR